jgi:hypothetical protein
MISSETDSERVSTTYHYHINQGSADARVEMATVDEPRHWTGPKFAEMLKSAGFSSWETRRFAITPDWKVAYNIARKA